MAKLVVSITHAKEDADKATVGMVVANAAVASGQETVVFFSTEGAYLAKNGYTEDIHEEVKEIVSKRMKSPVLIDSRAEARYLGKTEPIDRIPGHIPGAVNKFWEDGLHQGSFKNSDEQKRRFSEFNPEEPLIVYCGSGVSATPNFIALKMAGYQHIKLYVGSYSDWISYEDNPVE